MICFIQHTLDFVSIDKIEEVVRLTMDLVMQIIEFRLENKQI
jgi:hypothetical protein